MAAHPHTQQRDRIDRLCAEINDLIARYPGMPPGKVQSRVSQEINRKLDEIDRINDEVYEVEVEQARPGYFGKAPGQYQAMGTGILLILLGLLFSVYLLIAFGGIVIIVVVNASLGRVQPERPPMARERWEWRP